MNLEFLHEFSCYGYIAKSLPGLIHSANQFIKFPYIIVLTFIMNEYRGLQPIYLAPNHHRSWWVMGGNASWWVMGSPPLVLMGDGRALEHLDGWWGLPCGGLVYIFLSFLTTKWISKVSEWVLLRALEVDWRLGGDSLAASCRKFPCGFSVPAARKRLQWNWANSFRQRFSGRLVLAII